MLKRESDLNEDIKKLLDTVLEKVVTGEFTDAHFINGAINLGFIREIKSLVITEKAVRILKYNYKD